MQDTRSRSRAWSANLMRRLTLITSCYIRPSEFAVQKYATSSKRSGVGRCPDSQIAKAICSGCRILDHPGENDFGVGGAGRSPWLLRGSCIATAFWPAAVEGGDPGIFWPIVTLLAACAAIALGTSWWRQRKLAGEVAATDAEKAPMRAALDKAHSRIKAFSDSQGRFVGNLAHEIRGPLATAVIHADLLLASCNEPVTVQRYARSVAEDMRHLSGLVESFLRLARPLAQEDTSHHVPVHIHDLALEAVRRCQSLASTREVRVVPMLAESGDLSVEVLGDAVLLEAMIENLLRNAVLSAPRGTQVDLHVRLQGEEIVLSVRDHGARIEDDQLDSVLHGFFEVPTPPRPTAGTGLSLAIAKRVAEHHRGTISLRNVPEGGCEFEVQLPRWRPEGRPAGLRIAAPAV
jgi:signal transduction histidine kinase